MELTRRHAIAAGAAVFATAGIAQQPRPSSPESLDALARRSGRRFGSAVAWSPKGADAGSFDTASIFSVGGKSFSYSPCRSSTSRRIFRTSGWSSVS